MRGVRLVASASIAIVTLCYPFIVYFGINVLQPGAILGVLALALTGRLVLGGGISSSGGLAALAGLVFCLVVWLSESRSGFLYYPVVINGVLLCVFVLSLMNPPTVIERLARLKEPELPESGVRYTRGVTWVWVGFFAVNGSCAWLTAWWGDMVLWTLYNGFIAYVAIGLLFAIEWLVRQRVRNAG